EHRPAILIDEPAAVEDEAVVAAHEIGVDDRALVVGRAGGDHLAARALYPGPKGRGGQVDHDLGPGVAAPPHGPVWRPDVLADLERHRAEVEVDDRIGAGHALGVAIEIGQAAGERA